MASLGIDIGGTSVKLAMIDGGRVLWTAQSPGYCRPDRDGLLAAMAHAAAGRSLAATTVGICLPGLVDPATGRVTASVNVPGIIGLCPTDLLAGHSQPGLQPLVVSDAHATAYDIYRQLCGSAGRLLVLCLGTGVGAAVLDDGQPLHVDGNSPGHIGQLDVSLAGPTVIGPDGGAGGLEAYLGAGALRQTYGDNLSSAIAAWHGDEPPLQALARAIRICHAIYRPRHVYLAGGIGIQLFGVLAELRSQVQWNLTSIARPGWTLACAQTIYHAARGAAELASRP